MLAKSVSLPDFKRAAEGIEPDVYDDGYLRVEHDNYYISCHGRFIALPRAEFLIVSRLTRNPERIVKAEELWRFIWGDSKPFNPISFRVYIYRLRNSLAPFGLKIETMIHVGYRLVMPINERADGERE